MNAEERASSLRIALEKYTDHTCEHDCDTMLMRPQSDELITAALREARNEALDEAYSKILSLCAEEARKTINSDAQEEYFYGLDDAAKAIRALKETT